MTLLIILAAVFAGIALMIVLGERFGTPMDEQQQSKFSTIATYLCGALIVAAIIRQML